MKRLLLALALILLCGGIAEANGLTVWGLTEQDVDSTQNALAGRIGYQYDFIEGFIGSTWRPRYQVEPGELAPPQVFSTGALVHMRDILDPNNPLPWIPGLLLALIPEEMVVQPYFGAEAGFNLFEDDAGFYSGIVGLLCKTDADNKSAIVIEGNYAKNFKDLSAVPEEIRLKLGLRFYFN